MLAIADIGPRVADGETFGRACGRMGMMLLLVTSDRSRRSLSPAGQGGHVVIPDIPAQAAGFTFSMKPPKPGWRRQGDAV